MPFVLVNFVEWFCVSLEPDLLRVLFFACVGEIHALTA